MDRRKRDLVERNQIIKQLRDDGLSYFQIGRRIGISSSQVGAVLHALAIEASYPPLPPEVSLKTAVLFQRSFGHWPADETAALLAVREHDWIKAPGIRLKNIEEIRAWLKRVLVAPNSPE